MKTLSLYKRYKVVSVVHSYHMSIRNADGAIALSNDYHAIRWQRYDRIRRKLDMKIRNSLGENNEYCWFCGHILWGDRVEVHSYNCPERNEK